MSKILRLIGYALIFLSELLEKIEPRIW